MTKSLVAAVLLFGLTAAVQGAKVTFDFSGAETTLRRAIEDEAFPGCTVCVGTDRKIIWSAAYGHFDFQDKKRVRKDTIYDLASCTKVAGTTSVFMRLVAEGKLRVEEPVSKYAPDFVQSAANEQDKSWREQVRIEHLLTHSAGIAGWGPLYKSVNSYAELLEAVFKTPLDCAPARRVRYSDLSMMFLGEIATRAGTKNLAQLEQDLVFRPLRMRDTLRNPSEKLRDRIPPTEKWPDKDGYVHGVVHDENARAGEGLTGHAGLFSTAEDLGKLAAELLRALEGKSRLFPEPVVHDFFRERTFIPNLGRGLGWGISSTTLPDGTSGTVLSHTGFTGTSIRIDPARKIYIVLLSNRVHPSRDNEKIGRVRRQLTESVLRAIDGDRYQGDAKRSPQSEVGR